MRLQLLPTRSQGSVVCSYCSWKKACNLLNAPTSTEIAGCWGNTLTISLRPTPELFRSTISSPLVPKTNYRTRKTKTHPPGQLSRVTAYFCFGQHKFAHLKRWTNELYCIHCAQANELPSGEKARLFKERTNCILLAQNSMAFLVPALRFVSAHAP